MLPNITMSDWSSNNTGDKDDQKLFNESFFDIEPYSGGVINAAQKLMISALIEKDELFEMDSKFVPIYYVFRTGNLSASSIDHIFGDLFVGVGMKSAINVIFVTLITLFICLAIYAYIQNRVEELRLDAEMDRSGTSKLV